MVVITLVLSLIGIYVLFVIVQTLACFALSLATRYREVAPVDRRPFRPGAAAVAMLVEIVNTIRLHVVMVWMTLFRRRSSAGVLYLGAAKTPVLLVAGYGRFGPCWGAMKRMLRRRGAGPLFEMAPGIVFAPIEEFARRLGKRVDAILQSTGAEQIDLVGHSMGGLVARYYLEQLDGPGKVRRCVTIETPHHGSLLAMVAPGENGRQMRPGSTFLADLNYMESNPKRSQIVSIWSPFDDMTIPPTSAILGGTARNVRIDHVPHYTALFSPRIADIIVHELDR